MSTQNLASTVIESGRARWNKYETGRTKSRVDFNIDAFGILRGTENGRKLFRRKG